MVRTPAECGKVELLTSKVSVDRSKNGPLLGRRKTHDCRVIFFFRNHDHRTGTCRHAQRS